MVVILSAVIPEFQSELWVQIGCEDFATRLEYDAELCSYYEIKQLTN